jgi:hypothetical protein
MDMSSPTRTRRHHATLALIALAAFTAACGPATEAETAADIQALGIGKANLVGDNGLSQNGLSQNGLSQNGLSQNGLSQNGLSQNGFTTWFNQNLANSDTVMKYLYGCAAPSGSTLTWTNPSTGRSYAWNGALGLASDWASGKPATVAEQQVITSCLAAHVNKYGIHVPIAVEGRTAKGVQLPIGANELTTYSVREGCFFGNLFNGDGVFGGPDHASWNSKTSTARACVFDTKFKDSMSQCPPLFQIGYCASNCTADPTNTFYETCTYNGKTYKALATRIRPQEVYMCGDGVCQSTESCGGGANWDSCKTDCGLCP